MYCEASMPPAELVAAAPERAIEFGFFDCHCSPPLCIQFLSGHYFADFGLSDFRTCGSFEFAATRVRFNSDCINVNVFVPGGADRSSTGGDQRTQLPVTGGERRGGSPYSLPHQDVHGGAEQRMKFPSGPVHSPPVFPVPFPNAKCITGVWPTGSPPPTATTKRSLMRKRCRAIEQGHRCSPQAKW